MSDDNVVPLNNITKLKIPAKRVLKAAKKAGLTDVVIIGYDADGNEYFASSEPDAAEVSWLLERAKFKLMAIVDEMTKA